MSNNEDYEFILMYIGSDGVLKCRNVGRLTIGEEYDGPEPEELDTSDEKLHEIILHLRTEGRPDYVGRINISDENGTAVEFLKLHLYNTDLYSRFYEIMCDITNSDLDEGAVEF